MKRKSLTLLVCLLACLALGSVGFAAWVITSPNSQTATGQVRVDVVEDARLQVNAEIDGTVVFGSKTPATGNAYNWMKHDPVTNLNENLTVTLKLTIGSFSNLTNDGTALTVTFSDEEGQSFFAEALSKGYVAVPPVATYTKAELKALADEEEDDVNKIEQDELYLEIDYTFTWGTAFGGKNPIDFYNSTKYEETYADAAKATLEELRALLDNVSYLVTIEPVTDYN